MKEAQKNIDGFDRTKYRQLTNQETDKRYDLTGPIGFHGFSCERWTTNFEARPLSEEPKDDILKEEKENG